MAGLERLLEKAKPKFDLTEPGDQLSLYGLVGEILAEGPSPDEMKECACRAQAPLEFKLAVKLVESRQYLQGVARPLKLGVLYAMWGEHHRLLPKTTENPNGEDSLRVKLTQLDWACAGTPLEWRLYAVDDGDPYDSGGIAAEIAWRPVDIRAWIRRRRSGPCPR